jgi:RNA recognition motif-containing protein
LSFHTTPATLGEFFSQYGQVTEIAIVYNAEDRSKGHGFVQFATPEEAAKALNEANGKELDGRPLLCETFFP